MPDVQVTDSLDGPVLDIKSDLAHPSSLIRYLKSELLHLAVLPDFLKRKDDVLSQAAPQPIEFQANAQHAFQLGNIEPEISITPAAKCTIGINASPGTDLFDGDPFHLPAIVPAKTGYVSVAFEGSLDLGVSGSEGDLSFGFDQSTTVGIQYCKAFPLGTGEPTLLNGLGQTLSSYVIPADLSDLTSLAVNDLAIVSGKGSLKISGGVDVSASPNPLASVDLPLGAGTLAIKSGATAGLAASFKILGAYQIRASRKDADTIDLSIWRQRGTSFKAELSASGGISVKLAGKDLVLALLGAISTDPVGDQKLLADLTPAEAGKLGGVIKDGLDHSLQASLDAVLSSMTDDQAAFQYEIQPAQLTAEGNAAIHKALDGDLSLLTAMEAGMQAGGALSPGLTMLNSLLTKTRKRGVSVNINLIGIVNLITVSELIRHSEILTDAVTGDITIKETVTGNNISAIVDPLKRHEALRKAMFDSVLATTSYRAGKAIAFPEFHCQQMHFALNQNTNRQLMGDYLRWFEALNLMPQQEGTSILGSFIEGGPSTCVLRTSFGDADCATMFFDGSGNLRPKQYYLEIGRQAMRSLLDPKGQAIDGIRFQILDDAHWSAALDIGANVNLGPLVGLSTADPKVEYLVGDLYVMTQWAKAMVDAGSQISDLRNFVANADLATLMQNNEFKKKRDALQKKMSAIVKAGTVRFDEPWGMICLFSAAGLPPTTSARAVTQKLMLSRGQDPAPSALQG